MSLLTGLLRSVYSDATQLEVELSCVVIKGATTVLKLGGPSAVGASRVEAPRRWDVERGCLFPTREESGRGRAPHQKIFFIFYLKMVSFGAFWMALSRCM